MGDSEVDERLALAAFRPRPLRGQPAELDGAHPDLPGVAKPKPSNAWHPWEDTSLRALAEGGRSAREIARVLRRPHWQVQSRLDYLRLVVGCSAHER